MPRKGKIKVRKLIYGLIFALTLVTTKTSYAYDTTKFKRQIRVGVIVETKSIPLKSQIESYIKRELRALGDIDIVQKDAEKIILLKADYVLYENDTIFGVVVTSIFLSAKNNEGYRQHFTTNIKDIDFAKHAENEVFYKKIIEYENSGLFVFQEKKLDEKCKYIVAKFDNLVLEPERQSFQELVDYFMNNLSTTNQ